MKDKENKGKRIVIPQENIIFNEVDLAYSVEKMYTYKATAEINLFDINMVELTWDGIKYINLKEIDCIEKSPSPYVNEILHMSLKFAELKKLREPYDEFVIRNQINGFKEFLSKNGNWSHWFRKGEYVYELRPDKEITPAKLDYYKYFLPFRLRHVKPHNLADVLYHHRDKYYKERPHVFYALIKKIIKQQDENFWIHEDTVANISGWLQENIASNGTEAIYWFDLNVEYEESVKKSLIGLLLSDLKFGLNPFIDTQEAFTNFYRLFIKRTPYQTFNKINWTGSFGELHWFIKILETKAKCSSNKKWVACSSLFVVNKKEFHSEQVRENKFITPERRERMERIVRNITHNTRKN